MNIEEIRKNAPKGARFYANIEVVIIYLFKSNYGFRQIKKNVISFCDSGIPLEWIKPL